MTLARQALLEKLQAEQTDEVVELFTEQIKEGIRQSNKIKVI